MSSLVVDFARALAGDALRALARRVDPSGERKPEVEPEPWHSEIGPIAGRVVSPEAREMIVGMSPNKFKVEQTIVCNDPDRVAEVIEHEIMRETGRRVRVPQGT